MKYKVTNNLTRNAYLPGGVLLPGSYRTVELSAFDAALCSGNGLTVETLEKPKESKTNGKKKSSGKKKNHTPRK